MKLPITYRKVRGVGWGRAGLQITGQEVVQKQISEEILFFFFFFGPFRAACEAYGGSQASGLIRAVAAGLHHSNSNARSEQSLEILE